MLVFYSPDSLERLANAQTFFMDGTFSVAPHRTLVLNCAFAVVFTGQQSLDIVVTLGHNLGKDLAGFVSGFQDVLPGVHVYQACY
jgi:hypothetical protein